MRLRGLLWFAWTLAWGVQLRDLLLDLVFQNTQIIGILWELCRSDGKALSQRQLKVLPDAFQQVLACRGHQRLAILHVTAGLQIFWVEYLPGQRVFGPSGDYFFWEYSALGIDRKLKLKAGQHRVHYVWHWISFPEEAHLLSSVTGVPSPSREKSGS